METVQRVANSSTSVEGSPAKRSRDRSLSGSASLGYTIPGAFDSQSFNLSYSFTRYAGELPLPAADVDPVNFPKLPTNRGTLASVHLGWSYSNALGYLWSVGNENYDLFADGRDGDRVGIISVWRRADCTIRRLRSSQSR